MKIKHVLINVFLFLLVFSTHSQNKKYVDSILKVITSQNDTTQIDSYINLFIEHYLVDPNLAKPYADKAYSIAKDIKNDFYIAQTNNVLGIYYNMTSQYEKSIERYKEAVALFEENGNKDNASRILNNIANSYKSLGQFHLALQTHLKSLKLKDEINADDESKAASYWNIGNILGDIGNYDESNKYYQKAKVIYERENLTDDLESILSNIGINLKDQGKYEEAKTYLKRSIDYHFEQNHMNDLAGAYDNLGRLYFDTDSIKLAENYFNKSLEISKNHGEITLEALNLRNLGEVYLKQKQYAKALDFVKRSHEIRKAAKTKKEMILDYKILGQIHAAMGNYKTAYNFNVKYGDLNKEILSKENIDRINEMEVLYETEKQEKELIIQKNEIELLKQKEKTNKGQQLLLIIGIISTGLLGGLLYYGIYQKLKRSKSERKRLDSELDYKKHELTSHALHLAKKNEVLENLKQKVKELKTNNKGSVKGYNQLIQTINFDLQDDNNWENFKKYFEEVHPGFNSNVKQQFQNVTSNELRLMALLKMNLTSKEIANILNISNDGIKKARYRLRKKLELSTEDSLQELVLSL